MAPADRRPARSRADRARQPLPRPARPLRRAGDARRRVGGDGRDARRAQRLGAQRRRSADRRPRPRPRARAGGPGSPTSGSRTRRRPCPSSSTRTTPSTAGVAATRTPTRARSSAISATTAAPTAARTARPPTWRRPRSSSTGCAARARACGPPRARPSSSSPSPASTTSTTRSPRSRPRCRLGVGLEPALAALASVRAAFGRVETIEVAGTPVSILLIKNPAGANEVLRTLRLEAAESGDDGRLDLWIALNDRIADGRDVSWIWDADFELIAGVARSVVCAGTRAPELAVRLKYAGLDPELLDGRAVDRALARPRGRGCRRAAVRAPDLHRADRAPPAAGRARAREGVLAMSERPAGLGGDLA